MDMDTGRVIESKNKDTPMLIASITKIMTCIIAVENGNPEEIIIVDDYQYYHKGMYGILLYFFHHHLVRLWGEQFK